VVRKDTRIEAFRKTIYAFYRKHPRKFPWRRTKNPYRILVSEIMLQQTQVERVLAKYLRFIKTFPGFRSLSETSLREVLHVWQGLGYNRRAIALKTIAEIVMEKYQGKLPECPDELAKLPGIGRYSSAAISVFAFNRPAVLIETNIRRVFLHSFFPEMENIKDSEILSLIQSTLDVNNPREWYYALMDYGVMLKKDLVNPNRRSAHYRTQKSFHGSNRQARGMILRHALQRKTITHKELTDALMMPSDKIDNALEQLVKEGFLKKERKRYSVL
jgi:A/G-specific adenine glycosylase